VHDYKPICAPSPTEWMWVGHNIKFDLSYVWREWPDHPLPRIWDTQLAEYILTGQQWKYASLDELTEKYVGKHALKDDRIKAYWKAGIDTTDIPKEELEPYLRGDVANTEAIFYKQWAVAKEQGQLDLILMQMDALRATTNMALAGMYVDWEYVTDQRAIYELAHDTKYNDLKRLAPGLDPASPKQLSIYFFGGEVKEKVKEHDGFYKNGKPRFKTREVSTYQPGCLNASTGLPGALVKGSSGYYPTGDDTLHAIIAAAPGTDAALVASYITELRFLAKVKDTYYQGLLDLRFPNGFIYPQLNHCATSTGRLSCTSPNLQNQTDAGDVKRSFISRWGKDGRLIEFDYNQLEVVWLAYLSNDQQLIHDIQHGVDMHTELYKEMYGRAPTKAERKTFKPRSFQLIYGAGPKAIAEQGKIPLDEAKKFIKVFYARYKGVQEWHRSMMERAEKESEVIYKVGEAGVQYRYTYTTPYGRRYVFNSYYVDWKGEHALSPTELKNYPVQGGATGDMVPLILGLLQRRLEEVGLHGKCLLINTVHDSILIDCHVEEVYNVIPVVKDVMENSPRYVKSFLDPTFPFDTMRIGVSMGLNWQDMEEME
jgi:DNA polymerase I-like protein with 3'-5' exonuclease and polymerase domains